MRYYSKYGIYNRDKTSFIIITNLNGGNNGGFLATRLLAAADALLNYHSNINNRGCNITAAQRKDECCGAATQSQLKLKKTNTDFVDTI